MIPLLSSFNPSVGILGVQADGAIDDLVTLVEFQSLGRDSGCSSFAPVRPAPAQVDCFNPSVGILGVQACSRNESFLVISIVSIPRSGFWVFKLRCPHT